MNASLTMEGVLRCAPILLEASHVPATLATLLMLMQDHVWVSELLQFEEDYSLHFVLLGE